MTQRVTRRTAASFGFCGVDEIARLSGGLFGGQATAERLGKVRLEYAWRRAVGVHLRAVAVPASCRARRLVVDVRDNGWKKELDRLKPQILARLAALLPSEPISDICFRVRAASAAILHPASPEAAERPAQAKPPHPPQDPDLRARFSRVMGRYLANAR